VTEDAASTHHVPYAAPAVQASGRPTSITALAGIGIVLGSLTVLCKPAGLFIQLLMPMPADPATGAPNPVIELIRSDPAIRLFMIGSTITGTLLSLLLLMSSLGSLALKRWARAGMLCYAALAVVMMTVTLLVNTLFVGPEMERAIRQSGIKQPPGMALMDGWVGIVIMLVLNLWYPVLIFAYFTRPRAKLAFEEGLPRRDI
jgi:hypothetical protein